MLRLLKVNGSPAWISPFNQPMNTEQEDESVEVPYAKNFVVAVCCKMAFVLS